MPSPHFLSALLAPLLLTALFTLPPSLLAEEEQATTPTEAAESSAEKSTAEESPASQDDNAVEASSEVAAEAVVHGNQAWARATRPTGTVGAAYLQLVNPTDEEDALIAAASPIAGRIELHTHIHEGETMQMVEVERFAIPANETTTLQPGGQHLMIFELTGPLVAGMSFPLTLNFASGKSAAVTVIIGNGTSTSYDEAAAVISDEAKAEGEAEKKTEDQAAPHQHHEH